MSNSDLAAPQPALMGAKRTLGLHVLVVEDNEADAEMIVHALERRPAVVDIEHAADGAEALEMLDKAVLMPDLAIIDLQMPKMDGFKLLIEMSCRGYSGFPIFVLTSSTSRSDVVRSLFRGADKVMSKPNTIEELERKIAEMIAATG
ncbi:MAG: response regulator [Pseudomonadota bacterium]